MRIKHKDNSYEYEITYRDWRTNYLSSEKYLNYEIINLKNVVELHVIKEDGISRFSQLIDEKEADNNIRQFPNQQFKKDINLENYDKYLKPINSHLPRLKSTWYNLPKLKKMIESAINSKISKELWIIIRTIIAGLILYVLVNIIKIFS